MHALPMQGVIASASQRALISVPRMNTRTFLTYGTIIPIVQEESWTGSFGMELAYKENNK